jgi:peroxiredoxin
MTALNAGTAAPVFSLPMVDGGNFSLQQALQRGPVLLAFFKITCPVCQFALPYVERLYQAYGRAEFTVAGVSQDHREDTLVFMRKFGVSFPVLLDELPSYPVSNAYGLTNVPTLFWIAQNGDIELSTVGWLRSDMEQLNREMAQRASATVLPLFRAEERVPDFKAG